MSFFSSHDGQELQVQVVAIDPTWKLSKMIHKKTRQCIRPSFLCTYVTINFPLSISDSAYTICMQGHNECLWFFRSLERINWQSETCLEIFPCVRWPLLSKGCSDPFWSLSSFLFILERLHMVKTYLFDLPGCHAFVNYFDHVIIVAETGVLWSTESTPTHACL